MMNLIQKFFNKEKYNKAKLRHDFSEFFFSQPEHQWLSNPNAKASLERLFSHLPAGVLNALMTKYPVTFIKSQDMKERKNVGTPLSNSIVVFPEFQKLIQSSNKCSVAYLAHELAFVLYEMEGDKQDPLMAEVEADKFVCDIGFSQELEDFLLMLDETIEKRLRLTYLTIHHFTSGEHN
jgi:hypothetical protein